MNEAEKNKVKSVFERYPSIGIAYVFGSRARETEGLMSDYDFAIYADLSNREAIFEREPFRAIIEPKILNDYFDYRAMLRRYELTKA